MRILYILLTGVILVAACEKKDKETAEITGSWKLIELYGDPGDGSGDFTPVESEKIIEFRADGTVWSNGDICLMSPAAAAPTTGTYSAEDSTINSVSCLSEINIFFEIRGEYLILSYPCIEPCQAKFEKIQ